MPKIISYLKTNNGFRPQVIFSSVGSNIYRGIKLYMSNSDKKKVNYISVNCLTVKYLVAKRLPVHCLSRH